MSIALRVDLIISKLHDDHLEYSKNVIFCVTFLQLEQIAYIFLMKSECTGSSNQLLQRACISTHVVLLGLINTHFQHVAIQPVELYLEQSTSQLWCNCKFTVNKMKFELDA